MMMTKGEEVKKSPQRVWDLNRESRPLDPGGVPPRSSARRDAPLIHPGRVASLDAGWTRAEVSHIQVETGAGRGPK